MAIDSDIFEWHTLESYGSEVLDLLLQDQTMTAWHNDGRQHNIMWCTNDYESRGEGYEFRSEIKAELITGDNAEVRELCVE